MACARPGRSGPARRGSARGGRQPIPAPSGIGLPPGYGIVSARAAQNMSDRDKKRDSQLVEVESTDRWVAGKSEQQLIADLKAYLARLRDNPRSIPDRLRVAAIQLRLGRAEEALVHYEGVLRGYVADGRIMSAIALCKRVLGLYPDLTRIQRILAALYARAPHGSTSAPSPVTPVAPLEEAATTHFVVEERAGGTVQDEVVQSVFPEAHQQEHNRVATPGAPPPAEEERPTVPYAAVDRGRPGFEDAPTAAIEPEQTVLVSEEGDGEAPVLLTRPKAGADGEEEQQPDDAELVVLLTNPKKKR